jgi:hypothetical protein
LVINYEPPIEKGGSPMPGVVASAEEVKESTAVTSWSAAEVFPHWFPNIQAFLPSEVKEQLPPNHDGYSGIVKAIVSQEVEVDCFGGGSGSSTSLGLLLGKISHTRKTTWMLQLRQWSAG